MAWDKDRPYAPFWNRTDWRAEDYGSMDSYGNGDEVTTEMIDAMYADGVYTPPMVKRWNRKTKQYEECPPITSGARSGRCRSRCGSTTSEQRRAAGVFWWCDGDGKRYPMFAKEFNRLVCEGKLALIISGKWSSEKRGANYGVRLVSE